MTIILNVVVDKCFVKSSKYRISGLFLPILFILMNTEVTLWKT